LSQRHSSHSVSLRTDNRGAWDFEAIAARYAFDKDQQRVPTTASANDESFGTAGRVAVLDGTAWSSLDLKGAWREGGRGGLATHTVTFGAHHDDYRLNNPTYNTTDWRAGDSRQSPPRVMARRERRHCGCKTRGA
jgi:iron complex outermembrane receptor protein